MDAISCRHLRLAKAEKVLLEGIHCQIPAQQFTLLLGPNGAGKTSLLRCLAGLEKGARPYVWYGQRSLAEIPAPELPQIVAWAPEAFAVPFAFTVWDLVLMGGFPRHGGQPGREDRQYAEWLLELLGLVDQRQAAVPTLSSGELRKLSLARVLAQRTPIVLLDEPCANLDLAATLTVLGLLAKLAKERLSVCACVHDVLLARRFADFALLLKGGRLSAAGPIAEVLNAEKVAEHFNVDVRSLTGPDGEEVWSVRSKPQPDVTSLGRGPYFD